MGNQSAECGDWEILTASICISRRPCAAVPSRWVAPVLVSPCPLSKHPPKASGHPPAPPTPWRAKSAAKFPNSNPLYPRTRRTRKFRRRTARRLCPDCKKCQSRTVWAISRRNVVIGKYLPRASAFLAGLVSSKHPRLLPCAVGFRQAGFLATQKRSEQSPACSAVLRRRIRVRSRLGLRLIHRYSPARRRVFCHQ